MLLLLVAIISTAVCLMHMLKRKCFNLTSNVDYNSKMSTEENKESNIYNIITNTNAAYKQTATASTELEVMYDTIDLVEGTNELQASTENQDSKLNMEQNMAYEPSTAVQIPLRSNVAYYMHKSGKPLQENDHADDQYDYI